MEGVVVRVGAGLALGVLNDSCMGGSLIVDRAIDFVVQTDLSDDYGCIGFEVLVPERSFVVVVRATFVSKAAWPERRITMTISEVSVEDTTVPHVTFVAESFATEPPPLAGAGKAYGGDDGDLIYWLLTGVDTDRIHE